MIDIVIKSNVTGSVHEFQCAVTYQENVNCDASELHTDLTFRGPCIVIYTYNKTNEIH
jgi:hypothetical protein